MRKQEKENLKSEAKEHAVDFLMAEYSELNKEFNRLRGEGLNRLNFFIAITSSFLGGLVLLSQSDKTSGIYLKVVALGALFFLILIGWDTFRFAIRRDISTDENLRRMGRIRRFFADDYPPIAEHLPWQAHDEPTKWVKSNSSAIRRTSQSIISLLLSLVIAISVSLFTNQLVIIGVSGLISFAVVYALLRNYADKRFKKALLSANKDIHFPQEKQG